MGESTGISWTDATVNFWWGCTKVGPGCDHCYAETLDNRFGGGHWGYDAPRRKIASAVKLIHRLDNDYSEYAADYHCGLVHAAARRVFIQSMSDLFDLEVELPWFEEAWSKIEICDRIEIQIVTKRISAVAKRLAQIGKTSWPDHAGLIVTVVNQAEADRDIPRLIALKRELGVPWVGLSIEPMLGFIDLTKWIKDIDWVIVGGESGKESRHMHPEWAISIRDQCTNADVAFFFKQWGEWAPSENWPEDEVIPSGILRYLSEPNDDRHAMWKVGKKVAGDKLDGIQHHAFPKTKMCYER